MHCTCHNTCCQDLESPVAYPICASNQRHPCSLMLARQANAEHWPWLCHLTTMHTRRHHTCAERFLHVEALDCMRQLAPPVAPSHRLRQQQPHALEHVVLSLGTPHRALGIWIGLRPHSREDLRSIPCEACPGKTARVQAHGEVAARCRCQMSPRRRIHEPVTKRKKSHVRCR